MGHFGLYEPLVKQALFEIGPAPWSVEQLKDCERLITREACRTIYPHCQPQNVIDWLNRLLPAEREELVAHLNAQETTTGSSQ